MGAKPSTLAACFSPQDFSAEDTEDILEILIDANNDVKKYTNEITAAVSKPSYVHMLSQVYRELPRRADNILIVLSVSSFPPISIPYALSICTKIVQTGDYFSRVRFATLLILKIYRLGDNTKQLVESQLQIYLNYLLGDDEKRGTASDVLRVIDTIATNRNMHKHIAEFTKSIVYFAQQKYMGEQNWAFEIILKFAANPECYSCVSTSPILDFSSYGTPYIWKLALILVQQYPEKHAFQVVTTTIRATTKQRQHFNLSQLFGFLTSDTTREILLKQDILSSLVGMVKEKNSCAARAVVTLFQGNTTKLFDFIMTSGIDESELPSEWFSVIIETWTARASLTNHLRDANAPWYVDPDLMPPGSEQQKFTIIPAPPRDLSFVAELYSQNPVPGYELKSIRVVVNNKLLLLFASQVGEMERRHGKEEFLPHWKESCATQQELEHRNQVIAQFNLLAKRHQYNKAPHVFVLPLWHGTNPAALESLFTTGLANLASTDAGFFGKGIYATGEAEYAFRVYSSGALLLNWTAVYSPFPVIAQDEVHLAEKGNFENYDAHFAPVFSPKHPNTSNYHACEPHQQAQYTELVVFNSAQTLPHYIVELQPSLIPNPSLLSPSSPSTAVKPIKPYSTTATVSSWSVSDVCLWLSTLALSRKYEQELLSHQITGSKLLMMTKEDWKKIGVTSFGDIRKLTLSVARLG